MKKLFVLIVMLFCSCTAVDDSVTTINAETIKVTLSNGCYTNYVKFTYKGHDYLTDYHNDFLYHLPSCPCYQSRPKSILDYE